MLLLIVAIFALLSSCLVTAQLVYKPPASLLRPANTTDSQISLEQVNATGIPLLSGSANGTDLAPLSQLRNATNRITFDCNGALYGTNLRTVSCIDAVEQIGLTDNTRYTYGRRGTRDRWNFNLPQRWLSVDGLCAVDVDLAWPSTMAMSSEKLIGEQAVVVLENCVGEGPPNTGGVAQRMGGDNHLQVSLQKTDLTAICYGQIDQHIQPSCERLINNMPYNDQLLIFGAPSDKPDVELPLTLTSDDGLCAMTISTLGAPDMARWWQIWDGAVQLNQVCVRAGKKGRDPGIGRAKQLSIDVRALWAANSTEAPASTE